MKQKFGDDAQDSESSSSESEDEAAKVSGNRTTGVYRHENIRIRNETMIVASSWLIFGYSFYVPAEIV